MGILCIFSLAIDRSPPGEPFERGRDGSNSCLDTIRDHHHGIIGEKGGNLIHVGLQLIVGHGQGCLFIGRVFQFEDDDRYPIDEEDNIRPSYVFLLLDGILIHDKKFVVFRMGTVKETDLIPPDGSVGPPVFYRDPIGEHPVHGPVVLDKGGMSGIGDRPQGCFMSITGKSLVEPQNGRFQTIGEEKILE